MGTDIANSLLPEHRRVGALDTRNKRQSHLTVEEGNWLAQTGTRALRRDLEVGLDRATHGLTNLAGTLRTATELQTSAGIRRHLELAQEQADRTDRLQDRIGLVTSVLLVPSFIAGFFGANTAIPGQGHWSGFVLMVALMVMGAGSTYAVFRWLRSAEINAAARADRP